jgi:hypothetical protein
MRWNWTDTVTASGLLLIAIGVGWCYRPAGVIVLGLGLLIAGIRLDILRARSRRK